MTKLLLPLLAVLAVASAGRADKPPALPDADRVRIAEAFRLADAIGNRVWPDWDQAPFAVLLVTPDHEFLIRHPKPSDDFKPAGEDAGLGKVWYRGRKFAKEFEATFPAVNGVSTVVIGQAENTQSKTSTRWVLTALHEHFHQLQESRPRYYAGVDALGLAKGDTTGMWMLTYPFPYTKAEVKERFAATAKALGQAVRARGKPEFADKLAAYTAARQTFRDLLSADDAKYFAFQTWKEGIARYTEHRLAELAAAEYTPSQEFRALKDYKPFKEVGADILRGIETELDAVQLDKAKRGVVYSFGAAEALVLDAARPDWRKRYFDHPFTLDPHYKEK